MFPAGKRNCRIKLQRPMETQNPETGGVTVTWQDVDTVWANVRYLNGMETLKAGTTISVAKASIRIRVRADVASKWRALLGAVIFNILVVLPDEEDRDSIYLACETGANDG